MERFEYQAMTSTGRAMSGTLQADSLEEAQAHLAQMGLEIRSIQKAPAAPPRGRLGRSEFLLFNQQLASIARSGIPLERALRELSGDIQSRRLRQAVEDLAADLERGTSVEAAFRDRGGMFPPLYGHIVRAGVQSGRLGDMLLSLNRHLEMAGQTRRILVDALSYPLFVLLLASGVLTLLLAFVVPRLKEMFAGVGGRLPMLTAGLVWLGDHVVHIWAGLGVLVVALVAARFLLGLSPEGRRATERMLLRTPLLGRLYHRTILARLADSLALLIGAQCDLPTALRLAAGTTGSENLIRDCEQLAQQVQAGRGVLDAPDARTIPPMMLYAMELGSQRSELADSLYQLSEAYWLQARQWQGSLQALLMPMLLIGVGGVVACVLTALFAPMVQMISMLQKM